MPRAKATGRTRAIDKSVSRAERDLKSKFAFVAKQRANIWLTAAAVLFVLGIATAFVAIDENSLLQGNAGFLLREAPTEVQKVDTLSNYQAKYNAPASTSGVSGFRSFFNNLLSGGTDAAKTGDDRGGSGTGDDSKLPGDEGSGDNQQNQGECTNENLEGCAPQITGPSSGVQGASLSFTFTKQFPPTPEGSDLSLFPSDTKVDWGDGTSQDVSFIPQVSHVYLTPGNYTITASATYSDTAIYTPGTRPNLTVASSTKTVQVSRATSAVITAALNPNSPPAGTVEQNTTNVEFARVDLTNTATTPQTVNALLVGCGNSRAFPRGNQAAPQPFAFNKRFTVKQDGPNGPVWGYAFVFSSARELYAQFPNGQLKIDSRLFFKCRNGVVVVKPKSLASGSLTGASASLTIPASPAKVTLSLIADVGQMDPCTELQLGISALYQGASTGPLLANSTVGNLMKVRGINPYLNRACN